MLPLRQRSGWALILALAANLSFGCASTPAGHDWQAVEGPAIAVFTDAEPNGWRDQLWDRDVADPYVHRRLTRHDLDRTLPAQRLVEHGPQKAPVRDETLEDLSLREQRK